MVTSDDVVLVEDDACFPLACVPEGMLRASSTTSVCPWKGIARYHDVHLADQVVPDDAWTYRHPTPLARRVRGRVAFWRAIEVDLTAAAPHWPEQHRPLPLEHHVSSSSPLPPVRR